MQATTQLLGRWNQSSARMAFRRGNLRSNGFRRLAWGDGDPYPYTPRATFRYQWESWPSWEKAWHIGLLGGIGPQFFIWSVYSKWTNETSWARDEALRRARLRREAQELMVLEGEHFPLDIQPDRR